MPIRHGGRRAISGSRCSRATLGLTNAAFIHAVHGKHILGQINADGDNAHGLPLAWF